MPSNVTAETEMMTFVQRCQLMWVFKLRTVVSCLEFREAGLVLLSRQARCRCARIARYFFLRALDKCVSITPDYRVTMQQNLS